MNFIFDIGNVLVAFKPIPFLSGLFADDVTVNIINDTIFKSREWLLLDQGVITQEQARELFCQRMPNLSDEITQTMERMTEMLTPIADTVDLLPQIKNAGHRLYYLSNYHVKLFDYIYNRYEFFNLFDGGVVSSHVHMMKPNAEIYQKLIRVYELAPCESVFIDDVADNILTADTLGINTILFADAQQISAFLDKIS